jgi:hypothetical protein
MIGEAWPGSGGGGATGGVGAGWAEAMAANEAAARSKAKRRMEIPLETESRGTLAAHLDDDNQMSPPFVELTLAERSG